MSSDEVYGSSVVVSASDERGGEVLADIVGLLPRSISVCRGVFSVQSSMLSFETFSSILVLM